MNKDQSVFFLALTISIFIHSAFLIPVSNTETKGKASAPKISTRISLNLHKTKQKESLVEKVKKNKVVKKKKTVKKVKKITKTDKQISEAENKSENIHRDRGKEVKQAKESFYSHLLSYIEGYKYYPRIARIRGVEGNVEVAFSLHGDGSITNLKIINGPVVLQKAAERAIKKAIPMPICPEDIGCPINIRFKMNYRIN